MASISMEQKQLQAAARAALLTKITKSAESVSGATAPGVLVTLARAYALVVAPQGGGGQAAD